MNAKQRALKESAFKYAMGGLVNDARFTEFMDMVRDQRDFLVDDTCTDKVITSERLTLTALGEVRTLNWLLSIYEDFKNAPPPEMDGSEDAGGEA